MFQYLYSVFQITLELLDVLLVLIWALTVGKGYQQTTKVAERKGRVQRAEEGRFYILTACFYFYVPQYDQLDVTCSSRDQYFRL